MQVNLTVSPYLENLWRMVMKSLRMLVLMFAVGAFSPFLMQANAQQDVDPDHFDQAPAAQANVSKAQPTHHAIAANKQGHKHARTANKHNGGRSNHRPVQA
jgi:hypothetical protein